MALGLDGLGWFGFFFGTGLAFDFWFWGFLSLSISVYGWAKLGGWVDVLCCCVCNYGGVEDACGEIRKNETWGHGMAW